MNQKLNIGIIGFGRFGQFLAKTLSKYHNLYSYSRSNYEEISNKMKIPFTCSLGDFLLNKLDIIILSVSILSMSSIIDQLLLYKHLLKDILIIDVMSVKVYPVEQLKRLAIEENNIDILATHPMFGPDSGYHNWINLPFVYYPIRIHNKNRYNLFIDIFYKEQCKMIMLDPYKHDQFAAKSQFITHLTGRLLKELDLQQTPINTVGYETLLKLVDNTCHDSFDLFKGLYTHNNESKVWLTKIKDSINDIEKQLNN